MTDNRTKHPLPNDSRDEQDDSKQQPFCPPKLVRLDTLEDVTGWRGFWSQSVPMS